MSVKSVFSWLKSEKAIADEKSGGKEGLLFLANEAKRFMDPYVPADNLILAQNVRTYVEGEQGIVEYATPYAHYQWEGEVYVDPVTGKGAFTNGEGLFWSRPGVAKVPSGRAIKHSTFRHPLATSHWDKAMKTARMDDLVKSYQNYLDGKG